MTITAQLDEFIVRNAGRCVDVDGVYGCQCRDLVNAWADHLHLPRIPGPNAIDMWTKNAGAPAGWQRMAVDPGRAITGDVLVWGAWAGKFGHTAIFIEGDSSVLYSFDQNWPEGSDRGSPAKRVRHTWSGVLGWFRPLAAAPAPTRTLTEVGMFIIMGPRGAKLVGTGYEKELSGEMFDRLKVVPGMVVHQVDQRGYDVIGAALTQGRIPPGPGNIKP